ncbi:MAG: hypothetical protein OXF31_06920 [Gammaproteobacteria bacterium]|nr:hypothetical protein [Gammaproteobacteria bacterium]
MKLPEANEIELSVFGPGYGESIVIHIGSGKWAIIDSCLDDNHEPASISYLTALGIPVEEAVISVSASHWHDDHVKGLAKTLEACPKARLSVGAALRREEFLAFLQVHEDQPVKILDRGGSELLNCLKLAAETPRQVKVLQEDTIVLDCDADELAHNRRVELRALSPSSKQFTDFLRRIADFPNKSEGSPKHRISEPSRNDLSVAMLLSVGQQGVLLGADLEERGDRLKGWRAVVEARRGRHPLSHSFKVPHHGSRNAHNEDVWNEMLEGKPTSIVTPMNKGRHRLPNDTDLERLRTLSSRCYLTSTPRTVPLKKKYGAEIAKLINASEVKFDASAYSGGRVTIRWTPDARAPNVQLFGGAIKV